MLLALVLSSLAAAPAAAPHTSIAHAGFLRDARAELRADGHLAFEAWIQWPATITRKSFVVEGVGSDGAVLFSRPVTAGVRTPAGRHKRAVQARFDLELPATSGVQELRVRLAH